MTKKNKKLSPEHKWKLHLSLVGKTTKARKEAVTPNRRIGWLKAEGYI